MGPDRPAEGPLPCRYAHRTTSPAPEFPRAGQVLVEARAECTLLPRLGTRKLPYKGSARASPCGPDSASY